MNLKYLVTGTGRCGTVYLARVLTSVGVPCGHESIFDYKGWDAAAAKIEGRQELGLSLCSQIKLVSGQFVESPIWLPDRTKVEAESSYLAAPFLERLPATEMIHVVRHPIKVVNSFCNYINYFAVLPAPTEYEAFIYANIPELTNKNLTTYERACLYYVRWNQMIEAKLANRRSLFHRVEDRIEVVLKFIGRAGVDFKTVFADRSVNTFRKPGHKFSIHDLPAGEVRKEFVAMGERYGYNMSSEYLML